MGHQLKKYNQEEIAHRIYSIRGVQVMLDKDLATFYEIKPIRLREQVKRNPNRFPSDFVFQLSDNEVELMVSQNAIPSKQSLGGYLPYVFTEQGVAAVSGVIKSDKADEMSVAIARTFVQMRKYIANNAGLFQRLDSMEQRQFQFQMTTDQRFEQVFKALEAKSELPDQGIFFNGQMYDAYAFTAELIRKANKSIILIDNYVDDAVLTLLSKRNKNVAATIFTKTISKQFLLDVKKHNSQYPEIKVVEFKDAHDRFLILDETELYHFGASLKDLGKKWFAFSKMEDMTEMVLENLQKMKIDE